MLLVMQQRHFEAPRSRDAIVTARLVTAENAAHPINTYPAARPPRLLAPMFARQPALGPAPV